MTEDGGKRRRARRGRGEGSIFQRADGVWCASISLGYNEHGKRMRRPVYGKTKQAVRQKLTNLHTQLSSGTLTTATKMTVAAMLTNWLEDDVKVNARASTYDSYKRNVAIHIKPRIGHHALTDLKPVHVQYMLSEMDREGASPRLRQLVYANLHRALNQALKLGAVQNNVCQAVTRPRVQRKARQVLDLEQVKKFLTAANGDRLEALYSRSLQECVRASYWR